MKEFKAYLSVLNRSALSNSFVGIHA